MYKELDKSTAICSFCKKQVTTTMKTKNTLIHDDGNHYIISNIMVGVCDKCNQDVSIPQQSFNEISNQIKEQKLS